MRWARHCPGSSGDKRWTGVWTPLRRSLVSLVRLNIWEEKTEPQAVVHRVGNWTGCCSGQTGEEAKKSSELVFPEAEPYGRLWGSAVARHRDPSSLRCSQGAPLLNLLR